MKKIVLISVFVSSLYTYSQNPPIVPIEEWDGRGVSGTYYKDTNNVYNQFEGEWLWQSGNNSLRIILQKKEQVYHQVKEWYYEDMLVGEYQYIENGVEKINTLANINSQENNISASDILTTPFYMGCDDCLPNEKRIYIGFSDPVEAQTANGSATEVAIPTGGSIYGGSHTHPFEANGDKVTPMFSVSDIAKLGEIFAKSSIPASVKYQDPSKFFFTLTVKNGGSTETFAIKIDNAMQFMNFSNQYYNMTKQEKEDYSWGLDRRYIKTREGGGSMYDCLKDLFKFMNEKNIKGISIYQATDSNLSNWKKLTYNSENDIDETDCN